MATIWKVFTSKFKGDPVLWFCVLFLTVISILSVYSSTVAMAYKEQNGNTEFYALRHFMHMGLGLVIMWAVHKVDHRMFSRLGQIFLLLGIFLVMLTYFIGGEGINDAKRWIRVPVVGSIQPSDLVKLALILYLARALTRKQDEIKSFRRALVPILVPVIIVVGLILPSNLSTALVVFFTSVMVMFIGRVRWSQLAFVTSVGAILIGSFIFIGYHMSRSMGLKIARVETWVSRFDAFSGGTNEPARADYQATKAKIAIARGGVIGQGPGNSTQKAFLPNPFSDFIYSIIIEEYGLLGGLCILLCYLLILYRGLRLVFRSTKAYAALLAAGITFSIVAQAIIHMGVNVGLFPVTGLTLPLVSMGGTSMLFTSFAFGVLLSVSRSVEQNLKEQELSSKGPVAAPYANLNPSLNKPILAT